MWSELLVGLSCLLGTALANCSSNSDCSLNGVCQSTKCECDKPWSGDACDLINRAKANPIGMYGWDPNVSSWGGTSVQGDDGKYHLFVAEMRTGGLKGWGHESECTHAVSETIAGPYKKSDEVLGPECHNPSIIRDRSPGTKGNYLLFHIGNGGKNDPANGSSFMHYSASPEGPWKASPTGITCNNPSPAFHPNGTLFSVCNHLDITYTTTNDGWKGDWAPLRNMHANFKDKDRHWEDPFLWFDKRGNWHVLYHVYCLLPFSAHKECMSGHAFSDDGLTWHFSDVEPYNGIVDFTSGPSTTFSTRERPHLIFAPSDSNMTTPIGVVTAVSSQPVSPACDGCNSQACSQCKVTTGRDWTFTQLQPFEGYQEHYDD